MFIYLLPYIFNMVYKSRYMTIFDNIKEALLKLHRERPLFSIKEVVVVSGINREIVRRVLLVFILYDLISIQGYGGIKIITLNLEPDEFNKKYEEMIKDLERKSFFLFIES